jgi:hypothetical protein
LYLFHLDHNKLGRKGVYSLARLFALAEIFIFKYSRNQPDRLNYHKQGQKGFGNQQEHKGHRSLYWAAASARSVCTSVSMASKVWMTRRLACSSHPHF